MNRAILSLTLVGVSAGLTLSAEVTLMPAGAVWDYYVLDTDLYLDWASLTYTWFDWDNAAWNTGRAGFGTTAPKGATVETRWEGKTDLALRNHFELRWRPARAELKLACDNGAIIFINGRYLDKWNAEGFTRLWEYTREIPPAFFVPGTNTISVLAEDHGSPTFFDLQLTAVPDDSTPAALIYVDDDAAFDPGPQNAAISDPCEDGTSIHPFDMIQEGIDAAWNGDTVIVLNGTYWETIDYKGKSITLTGFEPNVPGGQRLPCPVIDGNYEGTAVVFASGEDARTVLEGFTITRGQGEMAGGILCERSHPVISNCTIVGNRCVGPTGGGAIFCGGSNASLIGCTISGNCGGEGALYLTPSSQNVFLNCIIWDNIPTSLNQPFEAMNSSTLQYPVFSYCNLQTETPLGENLNADPRFVQPGCWTAPCTFDVESSAANMDTVWVDGDYHIRCSSPCVDAGDPEHVSRPDEFDCDGESRVLSGRIDIGADEYGGMENTLTIASTGGGTVLRPGEGVFQCECGASIEMQASPETCYRFVGWTGTAVEAGRVTDVTASSATVTVDADYTLTANFAPNTVNLTVSSTLGGFVKTPGEGTFMYDCGSCIAIEAAADECHAFSRWIGTAVEAGKVSDPNAPRTVVCMDGDYTLEAHFTPLRYALTLTSSEGGTVVKPGEGEAFMFDCGTLVEIEATAKEHCYFTGWTGTAVEAGKVGEPDDPHTTVLMDADYALRANFAADRHTLVVTSTGGGVVYIVATGNEFLEQGLSDRAFRLDYGTKVLLMAIPQPEYQFQNFASWSGSFYGTMSCWEFSLEEDWYLMATFVPEPAP